MTLYPPERYIYDQFRNISTAVSVKSGKTCFYQYGSPEEIIENLRELSRAPLKKNQTSSKYPLIALFTDFDEIQGETPGIESKTSVHLIIATLTEAHYSSAERVAINFKPILYPLYDALIQCIGESGYYQHGQRPQSLSRRKTDRLQWGRNGLYLQEGNVFEDLIDAIEIQNLELLVINKTNL